MAAGAAGAEDTTAEEDGRAEIGGMDGIDGTDEIDGTGETDAGTDGVSGTDETGTVMVALRARAMALSCRAPGQMKLAPRCSSKRARRPRRCPWQLRKSKAQ